MLSKPVIKFAGIVLAALLLVGCGSTAQNTPVIEPAGGTLTLKVNPEIKINYDDEGIVTQVIGINDDGKVIVEGTTDLIGRPSRDVVKELVEKIGDAGYFVEEVEGGAKQIVIEIERGSKLPSENFLKDIAFDVQTFVDNLNLNRELPIEIEFDDIDDIDDLNDDDDDDDDLNDDDDDDDDDHDDDDDDDDDDHDDNNDNNA